MRKHLKSLSKIDVKPISKNYIKSVALFQLSYLKTKLREGFEPSQKSYYSNQTELYFPKEIEGFEPSTHSVMVKFFGKLLNLQIKLNRKR